MSFGIRDTAAAVDDATQPTTHGGRLPETLQGRIVSDLVAAMGGRLGIRNAEDISVEITVDLPVHSTGTVRDETSSETGDTGPPVLVVSDSLERRRALVSVLASAGLAPVTLAYPYTGEALENVLADANHPPRAALIEVAQEPFEACEAFLAQTNHSIPVTVLVNSGRRGDAAQCRAAGISAYLAHPVGPGDVADTLQATIDVPVRSSLVTRHWLREGRRTLEILIADDSPVNARLVSHLLEARGHAVTIVTDGQQAVEAALSRSFNIVLMDILMPTMTGIAAARAIRRSESGTRVPIVAMTAFAQQASREVCFSAGMDDYVTKPWQPDELIAIVERTASRSTGSGAGKSLAATP
jgi:CheY-like chemotaxis protein